MKKKKDYRRSIAIIIAIAGLLLTIVTTSIIHKNQAEQMHEIELRLN